MQVTTRSLGAVCIALLCILLTAGLWPFHAPRNDMAWIPGKGVEVSGHGTLLSSGKFPTPEPGRESSRSLELWLQSSATVESGTLLAFDSSGPTQFSLRQSATDLVIQTHGPQGHRLFVGGVFKDTEPQFVTLTASPVEMRVYINGVLAQTSATFRVSSRELSGQLVLANSPVEDDSWAGRFRGLALYATALTASDVTAHYRTWTQQGRPALTPATPVVAQYLFTEGRGTVVRGAGSAPLDLYAPAHFVVLHPEFLERPWTEFRPTWSYCKDILINIVGFVPFGFFLTAYFSAKNKPRGAPVLTVFLGFAVSLTIEVLQSFLPTRFSGTTDLCTNTLGTWCGAGAYHYLLKHPALTLRFSTLMRSKESA